MHFFYLDESGCTGRDLSSAQQPVFVLGGISIRDEGWNETYKEYQQIIKSYFNNSVPMDFEFHTEELFSPSGSGFFTDHPRENRNSLIHSLLDLIKSRKHQICYAAIDKKKMNAYMIDQIKLKPYIADVKTPYIISYDYLISCIEKYMKEKLGRSARALILLDKKEQFSTTIEKITSHRRFKMANSSRIKWIAEFSYPIDSEKNIMIQLSDMCIFLIRKYLEIESGYKEDLAADIKTIFRNFYCKIHDRLIYKKIQTEEGRYSEEYNRYIEDVFILPSTRWRSKIY